MANVDEVLWLAWLNDSGTQAGDPIEGAVTALLDQFKRAPGPQMLAEICVGEFYDVVGGKVVRANMAEAEAAQLRIQGHIVRVEPADDLPGKPARITTLRKRANLYSLCQLRSINRRSIAFALEDLCRWHLVPGDPVAGLALSRSIFRHFLMYGAPPEAPAVAQPESPKGDSHASPAGDRFGALAAKHRIEAGEDPLPSRDRQPKAEAPAPTRQPRHGLVRRQKAEAPAAPEPDDPQVEAERQAMLHRAASMDPPTHQSAPAAPRRQFVNFGEARAYWGQNGSGQGLRRDMPEVRRSYEGVKREF